MTIVKYRKIFFALSIALTLVSFYGVFKYGFNLGVDFTGGTILEVRFEDELPAKSVVEEIVRERVEGGFSLRSSETDRYIIRTRELSLAESESLVGALQELSAGRMSLERSNTVGPVAGTELQSKAGKAIAVVIIMIVLFITFAFRKVSVPVSSWKYGLATVVALFHDVVIPTGAFIFLGHFYGLEIDLLFVGGLLAILGYSVHDTIVVFDRVRENLRINQEEHKKESFEETVGRSVNQTMARSINTSLTLLITLLALYALGSGATRDFSLLLIIGVVVGTYSSIFLASPLLVSFSKKEAK